MIIFYLLIKKFSSCPERYRRSGYLSQFNEVNFNVSGARSKVGELTPIAGGPNVSFYNTPPLLQWRSQLGAMFPAIPGTKRIEIQN